MKLYGYDIEDIIKELQLVFHPAASSPSCRFTIPAPGSIYRGIPLEVGLSGTWSNDLEGCGLERPTNTDWPEGCGDREFDANTPFMINYTGKWRDAEGTWATNCRRIMRCAGSFLRRSGSGPHTFLLSHDHHEEFIKAISAVERPFRENGELRFEGGLVLEVPAVPPGKSYAINPESIAPEGDSFRLAPHRCVEFGSYGVAF